jgi:hypothetical protein
MRLCGCAAVRMSDGAYGRLSGAGARGVNAHRSPSSTRGLGDNAIDPQGRALPRTDLDKVDCHCLG